MRLPYRITSTAAGSTRGNFVRRPQSPSSVCPGKRAASQARPGGGTYRLIVVPPGCIIVVPASCIIVVPPGSLC